MNTISPLGIIEQGGFNPFSYHSANLYAAYWADDPQWTNPGDGQPLVSARDGSGNDRTIVVGGTAPTFTANALNGRAGYTFNGTDGRLRGSEAGWGNLAQPFTVISVVLSLTSNDTIWASDTNTAGKQVLHRYQTLTNYQIFAGASVATANGLSNPSHVSRCVVNGASSKLQIYNVAAEVSGNASTGTCAGLRIGYSYANTSPLQGSIGFVGVYNTALAAADASAFVTALGAYYGITV